MENRNTETKYVSGGLGFCDTLGIVFIVLKLCGVIDWPWIWVLAPIWISVVIALVLVLIILVLLAIFNSKGR